MGLNDLFPGDKLIGREPPPVVAGSEELGAIDTNPFNYLAAAAQGAFQGAASKTADDLGYQKKKKKKKKKKEEPEPEPEVEEHVPAQPQIRIIRPFRLSFWDRYQKYILPAGAAGLVGLILLKKRH